MNCDNIVSGFRMCNCDDFSPTTADISSTTYRKHIRTIDTSIRLLFSTPVLFLSGKVSPNGDIVHSSYYGQCSSFSCHGSHRMHLLSDSSSPHYEPDPRIWHRIEKELYLYTAQVL